MSITKILEDKEMPTKDKLKTVAGIVAKVRKAYGNSEVEISMPEVQTTMGAIPFNLLEEEGKLHVVKDRVAYVRRASIEESLEVEGSVLGNIEEYRIATDDILTNITTDSPTTYL